ncbi:hypothetical protein QYE76_019604 [Lolium multiflorum]|uniref:DUF4216 domain-containing protein n=1 Tax=Lolium multiflorum TaxID=4521 RepID=A0AAD8VNB1_LOLMU|nr:hypothetical protein QYE76_019604 [Lolium multiflorum]
MGEDEAEEELIFDEPIFDDPDDDLGRAILDAKMNCGNEKERLKLEKMLEDHNKLLYPNCENGQKKLGTTLELLQWKAENGTSDKGFEKLLKIIKKMLPGENVLPSSTYEAKKVVCPLGLEVQKIHACINDCILYRGEYENLNACPVCSALRYKIRRDDPGDVEGESTPRKRVPAKVMWPEGSISKGYGTEEVIEFCVDFIPDLKPIGVPESRYEGRLHGKGTLGKKSATCMDGHSFTQAHYTVLLNSILVAPYKEEHKEILRSKYPEQREDWIDGEHMKTFGGWLQTRLMNVTDDEQLYLLAKQPSSTISTFQGYEINGNTFYTFAQDKKSTNQNSGVRFDAEDGNGNKVTYYGYIEEIWELDYGPNFKVPLFRCKWFNLKDGVQVDPQYGMTTVDFKNLGYDTEPFVLASEVAQVFYVKDMSSKPKKRKERQEDTSYDEPKRHIVLSGKRNIVGVEDKTDMSEDYNKFDDIPPFKSQPTRAHPPTFEYRDPDASDDDDGDYDDYSGDYYRARHELVVPTGTKGVSSPFDLAAPPNHPKSSTSARDRRAHAVAVAHACSHAVAIFAAVADARADAPSPLPTPSRRSPLSARRQPGQGERAPLPLLLRQLAAPPPLSTLRARRRETTSPTPPSASPTPQTPAPRPPPCTCPRSPAGP